MPNNINIAQGSTLSQTEPVGDLIGNPPGWILYSGISIVAIVFTTILIGAYFVKYPDKITSTGTLTSENPPIEIVSRADGYIESIQKTNGAEVAKGDVLLYINNTTDQKQLNKLQRWIMKYKNIRDPRKYLHLSFPNNLQLGGLQGEYAQLQLKYDELRQTLKDGIVFKQINNLSREISKIQKLNRSLEKEKTIFNEELSLSSIDYDRQSTLKRGGVISQFDLEKSKSTLLQKERQFAGMTNGIIQNNIRIEQLSLEKLKLQQERATLIKNYQFSLAEIIARINSSIQQWSHTYTISATIDGNITYNTGLREKKSIKQGQILGHIIPHTNKEYYISAIYPIINIGKIEKGQRAIIKFDAFPYKEYGTVSSVVKTISKMPELDRDNQPIYEIILPLQNTIVTEYNDTIPYRPNMTATIEIITQDQSILERIFNQFISLIK